MAKKAGAGTYILVIALAEEHAIRVGSLGILSFQEGSYLYVGSALGGWRARLARHLRQEKRLHWHIDYLLQAGQIRQIWVHVGPERRECQWAETLGRMAGICPFWAPFGASDCACRTHLFYSETPPSLAAFKAQVGEVSLSMIPLSPQGVWPSPGGFDSTAGTE